MTVREVVVPNRLGLHARAAAKFVQTATRFRSRKQSSGKRRRTPSCS